MQKFFGRERKKNNVKVQTFVFSPCLIYTENVIFQDISKYNGFNRKCQPKKIVSLHKKAFDESTSQRTVGRAR